jgi:hypothetical protein
MLKGSRGRVWAVLTWLGMAVLIVACVWTAMWIGGIII